MEGEPALTPEGDRPVQAPSVMDLVSIAPWKVWLSVRGTVGTLMRNVATRKIGAAGRDGILG